MEWFKTFWNKHGDRLIYGVLALALAMVLNYVEMKAEPKTVVVGIMMICFNKMRGNGNPKVG